MQSSVKLQRRIFLSAIGLGVAAPLARRFARDAVALPPPRPVRLLNIFVPHGIPWEGFDPSPNGVGFDFKAKDRDGFAALEPYKQYCMLIRGAALADKAANHFAIRSVMTGVQDGALDSFDYKIATALGLKAYVLGAMPFNFKESYNENTWLARHAGTWAQAVGNPIKAANLLLKGSTRTGTNPNEAGYEAASLALSQKQVERLQKELRSVTSEQTKLKVHLEALAGLAKGEGNNACASRPVMPALDACKDIDPLHPSQFGKVLDAQLEVLGNSMYCGTGRVSTLQVMCVNSTQRFNFAGGPGINGEHHIDISHMSRADYKKAQAWIFERIAAKLLPLLDRDDPLLPGTKVIDNSIVYFTSEVSDGANHNSDARKETPIPGGGSIYSCIPQLIIGGGGGYFNAKGGRTVVVPDNRPHTDVLGTIADAMGVSLTSFRSTPVNLIAEVKA